MARKLLQAEALGRIGWTKDHLRARPKGNRRKVQIAQQLRAQTTIPLAWIADRPNMGTRGYAAWLLQRTTPAPGASPQPLLPI